MITVVDEAGNIYDVPGLEWSDIPIQTPLCVWVADENGGRVWPQFSPFHFPDLGHPTQIRANVDALQGVQNMARWSPRHGWQNPALNVDETFKAMLVAQGDPNNVWPMAFLGGEWRIVPPPR